MERPFEYFPGVSDLFVSDTFYFPTAFIGRDRLRPGYAAGQSRLLNSLYTTDFEYCSALYM